MAGAGRIHSVLKVEAQFYVLGIPTLAILVYILRLAAGFIPLLEDTWIMQCFVFAGGMVASLSLFSMRYRFFSVSLVLLGLLWLLFRVLLLNTKSEFDPYFISAWFLSAVLFFLLGWATGYGLSRVKGFNVAWPIGLLGGMIFLMAGIFELKGNALLISLAPFVVYAFYIIYSGELIRNFSDEDHFFLSKISRRLFGFSLLMALLLIAGWFYLVPQLEAIEERQKTESKHPEIVQPDNSLTARDEKGVIMSESMKLSATQNRDIKDSLLFVAHLDHFFPDGETPNPLYFVTDYYSKFDTLTQTFETDSLRPFNDLFQPQVSQIPLYFTAEDSSVLQNNMAFRNREVISAEIFTRAMSGNLLTAPSTAFSVQPIAVPPEFRGTYRSAYKVRMQISDLNSAYYVYNAGNSETLIEFQENRNRLLRRSFSFDHLPESFMHYYTFMPKGNDYDSIRALTNRIVDEKNANTQIDKMLAIRDYFLDKDSNDVALFRYTDNPGVPGLPSANRLTYFLFQNRKGYCAYFAGATLFMLRSQGIPSRIATGFLTIDRSNKNPGWYWFYGDQAHAWVQVYFPGYGWLDFDTTIPDEEQRQSPQPDQTPPLVAQAPVLVADGDILRIDTANKTIDLRVNNLLLQDKPYKPDSNWIIHFDVNNAIIKRDTGNIKIADINSFDRGVAVAFDLDAEDEEKATSLLLEEIIGPQERLIRTDELRIMQRRQAERSIEETQAVTGPGTRERLLNLLPWLLGVGLLYLMIPLIMWIYLRMRAKWGGNTHAGLYYHYHSLNYLLHLYGYERRSLTPHQFARYVVDPVFGTKVKQFLNGYLKTKYAPARIESPEIKELNTLAGSSIQKINEQVSNNHKWKSFLRVNHSLRYFTEEMPVFN